MICSVHLSKRKCGFTTAPSWPCPWGTRRPRRRWEQVSDRGWRSRSGPRDHGDSPILASVMNRVDNIDIAVRKPSWAVQDPPMRCETHWDPLICSISWSREGRKIPRGMMWGTHMNDEEQVPCGIRSPKFSDLTCRLRKGHKGHHIADYEPSPGWPPSPYVWDDHVPEPGGPASSGTDTA